MKLTSADRKHRGSLDASYCFELFQAGLGDGGPPHMHSKTFVITSWTTESNKVGSGDRPSATAAAAGGGRRCGAATSAQHTLGHSR